MVSMKGIELRDVSIVAGGFSLRGLSLKVEPGEFAVLMGKTGTGKTTILEAVAGLRQVTGGQIYLDGSEATRLSRGPSPESRPDGRHRRQAPVYSPPRRMVPAPDAPSS